MVTPNTFHHYHGIALRPTQSHTLYFAHCAYKRNEPAAGSLSPVLHHCSTLISQKTTEHSFCIKHTVTSYQKHSTTSSSRSTTSHLTAITS